MVTVRGPRTFGTLKDIGISVVPCLPATAAIGQGPKPSVAKLRKRLPNVMWLEKAAGRLKPPAGPMV